MWIILWHLVICSWPKHQITANYQSETPAWCRMFSSLYDERMWPVNGQVWLLRFGWPFSCVYDQLYMLKDDLMLYFSPFGLCVCSRLPDANGWTVCGRMWCHQYDLITQIDLHPMGWMLFLFCSYGFLKLAVRNCFLLSPNSLPNSGYLFSVLGVPLRLAISLDSCRAKSFLSRARPYTCTLHGEQMDQACWNSIARFFSPPSSVGRTPYTLDGSAGINMCGQL